MIGFEEVTWEPQYVEIAGGILKSCTIEDWRGKRSSSTGVGLFHYFVEVVERDGGRLGIWSGTDFADAMEAAQTARVDFEIIEPIRNVVGMGRAVH